MLEKKKTDCLLMIGTTLQTNLPSKLISMANSRNVPVIEINPEPSGVAAEVIIAKKSAEVLQSILQQLEKYFY